MSEHPGDAHLLSCIDGELSDPLRIELERHLEGCASCSGRYRALRHLSGDAAELLYTPAMPLPSMRLDLIECMRADVRRRAARRAPITLGLTALLLFLTVRYESSLFGRSLIVERGALPISSLTPGASQIVSAEHVCNTVARVPPAIPAALRQQVLRDYRMEHIPPSEYELDYLITPELGGLTDRRNLWPEPYGLRSWNAHAKDSLEHLLPRMVCSDQIDLVTAQREIATDWIGAYKKYLASERPIQLHARLLLPTGLTRD